VNPWNTKSNKTDKNINDNINDLKKQKQKQKNTIDTLVKFIERLLE
jgi:hypothetical protein